MDGTGPIAGLFAKARRSKRNLQGRGLLQIRKGDVMDQLQVLCSNPSDSDSPRVALTAAGGKGGIAEYIHVPYKKLLTSISAVTCLFSDAGIPCNFQFMGGKISDIYPNNKVTDLLTDKKVGASTKIIDGPKVTMQCPSGQAMKGIKGKTALTSSGITVVSYMTPVCAVIPKPVTPFAASSRQFNESCDMSNQCVSPNKCTCEGDACVYGPGACRKTDCDSTQATTSCGAGNYCITGSCYSEEEVQNGFKNMFDGIGK